MGSSEFKVRPVKFEAVCSSLYTNCYIFSGTEFEELLSLFTESSGHGIGVSDEDLDDNNWSLGQSFLFTVTVVTTVGNCLSQKYPHL